jgi:radical SAM superfamily enzyme YgiQ (UPF0313 family)
MTCRGDPKESLIMTTALLIKPTNSGFDRKHVRVNFEPLGLMYLSAFIKKFSRHTVTVVDAQAQAPTVHPLPGGRFRMGMSDEELADLVRREQPDVVGISCLFERLAEDVLNIARIVKEVSPASLVVVGGMDASTRHDEYLVNDSVDLVVVGSGEETFLEILDAVSRGEVASGIAGTAERARRIGDPTSTVSTPAGAAALPTDDDKGTIHVNPARRQQVPFDEYPYPDRDALPRALYDNRANQRISYPFARGYPAILIQSSRGCALRCTFCEIISVFKTWQAHSAAYVVGEIEECVRKYGAREFIFLDDNFMLKTKRVAEICALIVQRGLKISIDILPGVSVWTLTDRIIDCMIDAGLYRVCLPVESGNPKTLEFIRKPVNLEHTEEMIEYCNRRGLLTHANLIIGFPDEDLADIRRTIAWGTQSGLDAINFFVAQPVKGASMYEIYERNGWLNHEVTTRADHSWRSNGSWRTARFTSDELARMADEASTAYLLRRLLFLLRPASARRYLWPKVNSVRKLRYVFRVARYALFQGRKISSDQKLFRPAVLARRLGRLMASAARTSAADPPGAIDPQPHNAISRFQLSYEGQQDSSDERLALWNPIRTSGGQEMARSDSMKPTDSNAIGS